VTQHTLERADSLPTGVRDLLRAFSTRDLDPVQATEACLERIASRDPELHAFVWVDHEGAMRTAAERAEQMDDGISIGPLHGLPIAVKELIDVAGAPAEYSSQTRLGERASTDAGVVRLLRQAGAVIVGATRSHEFGWGITTQHTVRGGTCNPAALDRVPGGSSGGAAAAVAAGMVPACVATDTGGSIRIPSAFCGVAGIKPTFGTVPRDGVVPLAPSLDTVGVIAGNVDDLWPLLAMMQGRKGNGWTTWPPPALEILRERTIGFAPRLVGPLADASRVALYEGALAACESFGMRVTEVATPTAEEFRAVFTVVQGFEAVRSHSHTLGLYPEQKDRYGSDVAGRLEGASSITEQEYQAAVTQAQVLATQLAAALAHVDGLLTPVALVAPPFLDAPDTVIVDGASVAARDAIMGFTVPQNVAGLPTVTFPAGRAPDGLPFGLQVTCARGRDRTALSIGALLGRLLGGPPG
jgi:Asp-tRNA(Asn)/Glu-tRNA(Gln) amidotransferase A subunit family amidase